MWKVPCIHLLWQSCELCKHIGLSCFPCDFSDHHKLTESWSFQYPHVSCDGHRCFPVLPWIDDKQCQLQRSPLLRWQMFSFDLYKENITKRWKTWSTKNQFTGDLSKPPSVMVLRAKLDQWPSSNPVAVQCIWWTLGLFAVWIPNVRMFTWQEKRNNIK